MPAGQIRIRGRAELERAFMQLRRDVLRELRPALREIAEVVREDAERLAINEISHIGPRWSRMRIGVTTKVVYVAPKSRRSGGSPRPNLAGLLMDEAMQPALDAHEADVMARLDTLINLSSRRAGF